MGETLAETRVAVDAQRASVQETADRLRARVRRAVDLKAKLRENPLLFAALGAGAVFLVAGGPVRLARFARRRLRPSSPEKAYDLLPRPMQRWVDELAGSVGPNAEEARQSLAAELVRWRHDPGRNQKASKELAKQMAEGPPGPGRAAWKAAEAAATILTAALARRLVQQFLSGEPPPSDAPPSDAQTGEGQSRGGPDARAAEAAARSSPARSRATMQKAAAAKEAAGYSSMSRPRTRGDGAPTE